MEIELIKLLSLYGALGRPLTFIEILTHLPNSAHRAKDMYEILSSLVRDGKIVEENGFYRLKNTVYTSMQRRWQDLLGDMKWKKLMRLSRWFRHVPFIQFVLVSGSLSFGNVNTLSDFDVIVGVSEERMFTARYFIVTLFSLLHGRRMDDDEGSSPDKLCFNHFVTADTYEKPPHNSYRLQLYKNMVPLWGNKEELQKFIKRNEWSGLSPYAMYDAHRNSDAPSCMRKIFEILLHGSGGRIIEQKIMRPVAIRRLQKYIAGKKNNGRVIVDDKELEFHFNLNYEKQFSDTLTS